MQVFKILLTIKSILLKGRLYTDRIHDTAIILDDKIIDEPSFQLRPVNNVDANQNIVLKKG